MNIFNQKTDNNHKKTYKNLSFYMFFQLPEKLYHFENRILLMFDNRF